MHRSNLNNYSWQLQKGRLIHKLIQFQTFRKFIELVIISISSIKKLFWSNHPMVKLRRTGNPIFSNRLRHRLNDITLVLQTFVFLPHPANMLSFSHEGNMLYKTFSPLRSAKMFLILIRNILQQIYLISNRDLKQVEAA